MTEPTYWEYRVIWKRQPPHPMSVMLPSDIPLGTLFTLTEVHKGDVVQFRPTEDNVPKGGVTGAWEVDFRYLHGIERGSARWESAHRGKRVPDGLVTLFVHPVPGPHEP